MLYKQKTGSQLPKESKLLMKDDYGNEITENHQWTTKNFNDNDNCISRHSPRNVIHTTG